MLILPKVVKKLVTGLTKRETARNIVVAVLAATGIAFSAAPANANLAPKQGVVQAADLTQIVNAADKGALVLTPPNTVRGDQLAYHYSHSSHASHSSHQSHYSHYSSRY